MAVCGNWTEHTAFLGGRSQVEAFPVSSDGAHQLPVQEQHPLSLGPQAS